jgi:octaprenyl-diphosphate synthase
MHAGTRPTKERELKAREIYRLVENGLAEVERELSRHSSSNIHLIEKIGRYIQDSGGKRIRPALLLLSAQMCGYEGPICHRLAAVVEMIHAATLVHDDIIDNAKVRRGQPSINAQWGNEITVLMGDWLYMTSFTIALAERQFQIMDILTDVTRKMIEGELIQLSFNGSENITEEQHLDISMRKTAFLFSACAQIGGILGSAGQQEQERLRLYGLNSGLAFQIVDDLLDLTSEESILGKPVGSDLREGKLTLPLIHIMKVGEPRHREMIRAVLRENGFCSVSKQSIVELLREYHTTERVFEQAHSYAAKAKEYLAGFPDVPARTALLAIPDYILDRDR